MSTETRLSAKRLPDGMGQVGERALALLRSFAQKQQGLAAELSQCRKDLKALVLGSVEGLETLTQMVEAFADSLPAEHAKALEIATRSAWDRLELAGVVRDGCLGEALDVSRHKVVKRRSTDQAPADTVVQVLSSGLLLRGERLREAAVVVAQREGSHAPSRD